MCERVKDVWEGACLLKPIKRGRGPLSDTEWLTVALLKLPEFDYMDLACQDLQFFFKMRPLPFKLYTLEISIVVGYCRKKDKYLLTTDVAKNYIFKHLIW